MTGRLANVIKPPISETRGSRAWPGLSGGAGGPFPSSAVGVGDGITRGCYRASEPSMEPHAGTALPDAKVQRGDQTCPMNPATAVTVELPRPLGNRKLRDGRTITTDLAKLIGTTSATAPDPAGTENPPTAPTT
jgi:hypothetical protein